MGKNGVEVIIFNAKKWLNERHIETQLEHSNLPAATLQYSPKLRKKDKNYKIVPIINLAADF